MMTLGSLNQSHPPPSSKCFQIRMRTNFYNLTRKYWTELHPQKFTVSSGEGSVINLSLEDLKNLIDKLVEMLKEDAVGLGYALRRHNIRIEEANASLHHSERHGGLGLDEV